MLAARDASAFDVVHYQWLTLEPLDRLLLARGAPRVLTAHNVLRRGARSRRALRSAMNGMDAVVAHTEEGAAALREETPACRCT